MAKKKNLWYSIAVVVGVGGILAFLIIYRLSRPTKAQFDMLTGLVTGSGVMTFEKLSPEMRRKYFRIFKNKISRKEADQWIALWKKNYMEWNIDEKNLNAKFLERVMPKA